jgi:hypothetical protein
VTGAHNKAFLIVLRELASPTGLLDEVTRRDLLPLREKMEAVIRELLGPHASRTQVQYCTTGIVSQCIVPMFMKRMDREAQEGKSDCSGIDDIESYADHVVKFSMAGIRSMRAELERETKTNPQGHS